MRIPFLDLQRQYRAIEPEITQAINRVLASQYFILGPELEAFERAFAAYLDIPFVVGVDNGTDGLQLALRAFGIGPGDEVITQANTFIATIVAIEEVGATPVLVDVDPETQQIDVAQVEKKISKKTKALLPVHLFGAPCAIETLVALAAQHKIFLIEDACQAHGSTMHGKRLGTFGDASVFSFYPGKNLGAYGNGGAVCCTDPVIDQRLRRLRNFGQDKKYIHLIAGVNSRLDDIQAAVLSVKLRHLDEWNHGRNAVAARYRERLHHVPMPTILEGGVSNYHLFVVESDNRDALQAHLDAQGIQAQMHYPTPVHCQPGYQHLGYAPGDFPIAERCARRILSLPMYPELTHDEVDDVCTAITAFSARTAGSASH